MASPDRLQIDDHFAQAKARARAPKPAAAYGTGSVLLVLAVVAAAAAGAWWWAVQPPSASTPHPVGLPTVAERQAAVAADVDRAERGPVAGGETSAQYQARLATLRAQGAAAPPADVVTPDRAAAGRGASAPGGSAAAATTTRSTTATPAAATLGQPDASALLLAGRVNEHRQGRAAHLRWLDACERQGLVNLARATIARARTVEAANSARIAANNLAADIDTHQREARRIDGLLTTAEQRLADYCAAHGQQVPPLDNPPVTVTGVAAQPRAMPAAVNRQASTASRSTGGFNPFADQP